MIKTPRNAPCSDWEDNWADRLDEAEELEEDEMEWKYEDGRDDPEDCEFDTLAEWEGWK